LLGLETSCDETAVAVYDGRPGLLAHEVYSQVDLHAAYGGVVAELASRDHLRKLLPLLGKVLAGGRRRGALGGVAYTSGPGLVGAAAGGRRGGAQPGLGLAAAMLGVHHMEGHLLAPLPRAGPAGLPVRGAARVRRSHAARPRRRGRPLRDPRQSLDDAAGEAFDKTAKLLGLGYPGRAAASGARRSAPARRVPLPASLTERPASTSVSAASKTAVVVALRGRDLDEQDRADAARAFEEAVVDTLLIKCERALEATDARTLVIAGGVGANRRLRARALAMVSAIGVRVVYPRVEFCTDNAAMIALVGHLRLAAGERDDLAIRARARWAIGGARTPDATPP